MPRALSRRPKVSGCGRSEDKINEKEQKNDVSGKFLHGVKRANDNMKCEPGKHEPPRPVVPKQQKDSTEDCQQANSGNQKIIPFERPFSKVIDEANRASKDEQAPENENGPGTFHVVIRKPF